MTAQEIATLILSLIAVLFVVAVALFLLALGQLRRGRRGPYWRLRRQASQRGGMLLLISLGLFAVTFALAFYSGLAAVAFRGIDDFFAGRNADFTGVIVPTSTPTLDVTMTPTSPSATPSATLTATTVPSATIVPSATVTLTPTQTASPTLTQTPTLSSTPSATATFTPTVDRVLQLIPPVTGIPPRPAATIQITAADEIAIGDTPLEPRTTFPSGITRIYLFLSYDQMDDGVAWSRVLYRDGEPIQGQAYLWSQGEAGKSYFFFGDEAGYPPGNYEVRLYIGEDEVNRFEFVITGL